MTPPPHPGVPHRPRAGSPDRRVFLLLAVTMAALAAFPASAQLSVAPADEQDVVQGRLNDQQMQPPPELRTSIAPPGQAPAAAGPAPPAWIIEPRMEVQEEVTDNARQSTTNRTADLVTYISPGIFISGDTPALRTTIDFTPSLQRNVVATDQNGFFVNGLATADATVVPEHLFFDARATAFEASRTGGDAAFNTANLPVADRTQVYAYSASPVLRTRLFDDGTGELRYSIGQTQFTNNAGALPGSVSATPVDEISSSTVQELRASVDSNDSFGRVRNHLILDASNSDVTSSNFSSKAASVSDETRYRLTDTFTPIGTVGYQIYDYPDSPAADEKGIIALGGFEYQPRADTYFRLQYGHRDGINSFLGEARYAITPLTTAFAGYVEGISTPQQAILGGLAGAAETSTGTIVNSQTGLPLSLYNAQLALQNDILRYTTFTGGLTANLSPNSFTATLVQQTIQSLTGATANDSSIGGTVNWTRAVSPTTNFSATASYYRHDLNASSSVDVGLLLTHTFTETLFGSVHYEFAKLDSDEANTNFYQNLLTVTMRKIF
jgi:uncharacterized protein (PEP-CTERM system associated)